MILTHNKYNKARPIYPDYINPLHHLNVGLIGYYRFNEGVGNILYDKSILKYGANMTLSGHTLTGNVSNWTGSEFGGGLAFDGSDRAEGGTTPNMTHTDPLTLCCWFEPHTTATDGRLVTKRGNGSRTYMPMLNTGAANLSASNKWEGSTVGNGDGVYPNLIPGRLYFNVATFDGPNTTLTFYQNGIKNGSWNWTGNTTTTSSSASWLIGCRRRNTTYEGYFNGRINEVRIYNRVLPANEIFELFENPHYEAINCCDIMNEIFI